MISADKIITQKPLNLSICVIIPTYNNEKTLRRVINGVLLFTDQIIIVNDGSTDSTPIILEDYKQITQIHFDKNKGKGMALRVGFEKAKTLGFLHAITIDSDGQHFPENLPLFEKEILESEHPVLLIGSRNMTQENVPKKSSFGNKFSNFWFWFETGKTLTDTQSGFRSYPLQSIPNRFFTPKFEFEIEVIVRSSWKGIEVKNIPIDVLYDPTERVSHFRPFKDFARISVLNTVLVTIALLYIKPRDFVRKFKKKSFKQFIKEDVLASNDSIEVKALSIALGTFIGIAPLWGFQTFLSIFLAVVFRLNKVLSFVFSNVSIPPMIPIIIYLSLKTGGLFVSQKADFVFSWDAISTEFIKIHLLQYIIGSLVLAVTTAAIFGLLSYSLLLYHKKRN
ncbi:DUF2062 domain-containing protein [Flavobacterium sp. I3-2]|uniref:DUF2062 domain-containing protein n=1 Tax=Flavobacterium sp. I3-2 TaxID=2748319 RepID=UPI0015B17A7E|nr:DUF2062 domain-containing protein [Flavobacterium sp. I3-2]